jgi:hypothetical protein
MGGSVIAATMPMGGYAVFKMNQEIGISESCSIVRFDDLHVGIYYSQ